MYEGSGENYITRSSLICNPHQIYLGDQMKKNMMGQAFGMYGR